MAEEGEKEKRGWGGWMDRENDGWMKGWRLDGEKVQSDE